MSSLVLVAQSSQGGGMSMIIMMVAIFAIMWFFMIKPQQKKQKEIQKFQNDLIPEPIARPNKSGPAFSVGSAGNGSWRSCPFRCCCKIGRAHV